MLYMLFKCIVDSFVLSKGREKVLRKNTKYTFSFQLAREACLCLTNSSSVLRSSEE